MYCKKCGKELPKESVFCPKCGQKISEDYREMQEKSANSVGNDSKDFSERIFGCDKKIIYGGSVILLLVVIIAVSLINIKKSNEDTITDENENIIVDVDNDVLIDDTLVETAIGTESVEVPSGNDYQYDLGDIVYFGEEKRGNIEWIVIGRENGKALLLQNRLANKTKAFGSRLDDTIRWENSELREYLNGEFYDETFSDEEKNMIIEEKHETNNNPVYATTGGNSTSDKVFILSTEEVEKYLPDAGKRITHYEKEDPDEYQPKDYILRTMGVNGYAVCFVDEGGNINYEGQAAEHGHCRYAIWVKVYNDTYESDSYTEDDSLNSTETTIEVGDNVELGKWVQDGDSKSIIKWNVIEVKDNRALLISSKNLDMQYYNSEDGKDPITWEKSYARKWLEETFYEEAFTEEEKKKICLSDISTPDNEKKGTDGGNDTKDHVFLLSRPEAEKYLPSKELRNVENTQYVKDLWVEFEGKGYESKSWATRSPGKNGKNVQITSKDDKFSDQTANHKRVNIRPALWLDLEAAGYKAENIDIVQAMAENAAQILNEESTKHTNPIEYAIYDFNCDGDPELLFWIESKYNGHAYLYKYDGISWKALDEEFPAKKIDKIFWNPDHNTFVIEGIDGDDVIIYECDAFADRATEDFSFKAREDQLKKDASKAKIGNQLENMEISSQITVQEIKRLIDKCPKVEKLEDSPSFDNIDVEAEVSVIRDHYYNPGELDEKRVVPAGTKDFNYERQYYYHDGELYFAFIFNGGEEYRFYYVGDKLIRYIDSKKTTFDKEDATINCPEWENELRIEAAESY